jgi:hypothetical protein
MKPLRKTFEADWEEINRYASSSRAQFLGDSKTRMNKRRSNQSSKDSYGRRAARTLAYGMQSGLSPSSMPWFKLKATDDDLNNFQQVKEWLAEVERLIYEFFADIGIYDTFKLNYRDLGNYGVSVGFLLEHEEYGGAAHHLDIGNYWIAEDDAGRTDTCYRDVFLTVGQMVRMFPWASLSPAVRKCWEKGQVQTIVPTIHAVERNLQRDPSKLDIGNKMYRSVWWEQGNTDKAQLLRQSGYDSKPFWGPRWETTGHDVYSDASPGFDALPDLREMQLSARRRGYAKDMMNRPPMKAPTGLAATMLRFDPGSINFAAATDLSGLEPIFSPQFQTLQAIREDHLEIRRDVAECYYVDLFRAISEREGVQPLNDLETSLRNDEKYTQLGPVVDRVNVEMLEVAVDRAYNVLDNLGRIPPAPPDIQGKPLVVDFVSMLAQAQRASQNSAIERIARYVGFIGGMFPEAVIKFDAEQSIDAFAEGIGAPPKIIRSDQIIERMREEQAQQAQMEQMAAMAPAMRDGAQAAELLSRTNVTPDQNALQVLSAVAPAVV